MHRGAAALRSRAGGAHVRPAVQGIANRIAELGETIELDDVDPVLNIALIFYLVS